MNLVRTGVSATMGAISGGLATMANNTVPVPGIGTVTYDAIVEAAGLIVGGAVQWFAPNTMPSVIDGLVDGSAALLTRRGVYHALKGSGAVYTFRGGGAGAWQANGLRAGGATYGNVGRGSRGNIYTNSGVPTVQIN